jgi:hypothetical protein
MMLIKRFSKLIVVLGPLIIFGTIVLVYCEGDSEVIQAIDWYKSFNNHHENAPSIPHDSKFSQDEALLPLAHGDDAASTGSATVETPPHSESEPEPEPWFPALPVDDAGGHIVNHDAYREVFSVSTMDRKYFAINFGPDLPVMNPNIIPHPHYPDTWIVVAQREKGLNRDAVFEEMVCNAVFQKNGSLVCATPPAVLPVAPTFGDKCEGELSHFALAVGPHDMRVFHGPHAPLAVFGSQSVYACFGLFAQDFRDLVADFGVDEPTARIFGGPTELQRPPPWGAIEKNWFLFWDLQGQAYLHHDINPKRVFAQLSPDGSTGSDLAPLAGDEMCMEKYMPKPDPKNENESLHQATNSLSITLCRRSDPLCQPNDENTFIMTIFQYKTFRDWHSSYEPYVMLFHQNAPFSVHAISTKPIWIHGRGALTKETAATWWREIEFEVPKGHSEMFYITSMSWRDHGQQYHGYIDDVLFLAFGIEDSRAAAIDILAGDLLQDLGHCADLGV